MEEWCEATRLAEEHWRDEEELRHDEEDHKSTRTLLTKMLEHATDVVRPHQARRAIWECDYQEEDGGEVSLMSHDTESSIGARTRESSWYEYHRSNRRRIQGEETLTNEWWGLEGGAKIEYVTTLAGIDREGLRMPRLRHIPRNFTTRDSPHELSRIKFPIKEEGGEDHAEPRERIPSYGKNNGDKEAAEWAMCSRSRSKVSNIL